MEIRKPRRSLAGPRRGERNQAFARLTRQLNHSESPSFREVFAMILSTCQHEKFRKSGTTPKGAPRYRCCLCGKSWTKETAQLDGMRIGLDKAARIVEMLCEGNSVSATARMMKTSKRVVLDTLVLFGERCEKYTTEA